MPLPDHTQKHRRPLEDKILEEAGIQKLTATWASPREKPGLPDIRKFVHKLKTDNTIHGESMVRDPYVHKTRSNTPNLSYSCPSQPFKESKL
jgi:hypothetical protein